MELSTLNLTKRQFPVGQPNMPSLWVFLIIVLGILLALVLGTSFVMHMLQRRQRAQLQRRIIAGEVDLEALGIKRMNVPQSEIDKMPVYTYTLTLSGETEELSAEQKELLQPPPKAVINKSTFGGETTKAEGNGARHSTLFAQTTCPICLDDYVSHETTVRSLPCSHIFHPECIDPFLRDNSSLCPCCKKSALPPGFCPVTVTNIMVRRERLTRQMRESRRRAMQSYFNNNTREAEARMRRSVVGVGVRPRPVPAADTTTQDNEVENTNQRTSRESRRDDTEINTNNLSTDNTTPTGMVPGVDTELGHIPPRDIENNAATTATATISGELSPSDEPPAEIAAQGIEARRRWRRERLARERDREFEQEGAEARQADEKRPWYRRMLGLS